MFFPAQAPQATPTPKPKKICILQVIERWGFLAATSRDMQRRGHFGHCAKPTTTEVLPVMMKWVMWQPRCLMEIPFEKIYRDW